MPSACTFIAPVATQSQDVSRQPCAYADRRPLLRHPFTSLPVTEGPLFQPLLFNYN